MATLAEGVEYAPGKYPLEWDGSNKLSRFVASGVYFVKVRIGSAISVSKVLVLK